MHLSLLTKEQLSIHTSPRHGETKLGQTLPILQHLDELKEHEESFVIFGIPEDIGIRANRGKAGAAGTWNAFLSAFCNIQSNEHNNGNALVLGHIVCDDLMTTANALDTGSSSYYKELGALVQEIDQRVSDLVKSIVAAGKTPIAIGGGHNNAFGMIEGTYRALKQPLHIFNLDAHTDLRMLEERHSGNGFSYALDKGYIAHYHVQGLHKNYTPSYVFEQMNNDSRLSYQLYENTQFSDIEHEVNQAMHGLLTRNSQPLGVELDCDVMEQFNSSAMSPVGYSVKEIRWFLSQLMLQNPAYIHICEAQAENQPLIAKALSYFVSDIMRG